VGGAALIAVALLAAATSAASDSCREWKLEHRDWKTLALGRYLHGAPQRELDEAVFEMLQREAYLTSCEISVEGGRSELVGWRLVGRLPEDYGSAVVESVLERAGFDLTLREMFATGAASMASAPLRDVGPLFPRRVSRGPR
jgi:hypothetical protein